MLFLFAQEDPLLVGKSHFLTRNYISVSRGICNIATQLKAKLNTFYCLCNFPETKSGRDVV